MKTQFFPAFVHCLALVTILASCESKQSTPLSYFEKEFREQGYVAYVPPAGNPGNRSDWRKLGPGAIVRRGRPDAVISATHIVGDAGIDRARHSEEQTVVDLFKNATVNSTNISATGGLGVSEAAKIQAAAKLARNTEVDISFGETREASAFDELELRKMVRANRDVLGEFRGGLLNNQLHLVKSAIYTTSLKFSFKQRTERGGSISLTIPGAQAADIAAAVENAKVVNGSVVIDSPRFIGYRPLRDMDSLLSHPAP